MGAGEVQMNQQAVVFAKGDSGGHKSYQDPGLAGSDQGRLPRRSDSYIEIWPNFTARWSRRIPFCLTVWYGTRKEAILGNSFAPIFWG